MSNSEPEIDELLENIELFDFNLKNKPYCWDESEQHALEDNINCSFIKILSKPNKLSPQRIQEIAKMIKETVNDSKYDRWYS